MSNEELKNTVWVNKLSKDVSKDNILEHFKGCGNVQNVSICSSRNRNFTYCFLEFENNDSVQQALALNESKLGEENITVALADSRLYERSIRRTDAKLKLNEKVVEEIQNMDKLEAYYHGFRQGKKYMIKKMTRNNGRRNVRYVRRNRNEQEQA